MRVLIIILIVFTIIIGMMVVSCMAVNADDSVDMIVYKIVDDVYTLESESGNLWDFMGCPLSTLPAVGDTVQIDVYTRQWIVE